ncbi:MAG TPA: FHA domain-containing protein [Pirellulales bacterium]|jgi:pSer/pThr/pTyr-binding forkhead associated (FHA) protein|nr:FHA domain-containing protein [Pirellulales bacterium]
MRVVLRVHAGRNAGQEIPIRVDRFLIGRADDCHLRANSTQVSRYHCAVIVEEQQVWVRDYGSRNGTFVQGARVAERCRLNDGDQLQVGPLHFVVVLQQEPPGVPATGLDTQPSAAGETAAAGKLRSTLRAIGRQESPTQEGEILEILSEPVEPQKAPSPLGLTDQMLPPPQEAPPAEPKAPPKPNPFRPPQKVDPADAAVDGLKRLFTPKKQ